MALLPLSSKAALDPKTGHFDSDAGLPDSHKRPVEGMSRAGWSVAPP